MVERPQRSQRRMVEIQGVCLYYYDWPGFSWLCADPGIQIGYIDMTVLRPHNPSGRSSRSSVSLRYCRCAAPSRREALQYSASSNFLE